MGRDIKFRAWNENYKQMKKLFGIDMEEKRAFLDDELMSWWMLDHCEAMQYTGLKDNTGSEIYEGDIIEFRMNTYQGTYRGKVIFEKGCFILEYKIIGGFREYLYQVSKAEEQFEVIGNIYEAPHLL